MWREGDNQRRPLGTAGKQVLYFACCCLKYVPHALVTNILLAMTFTRTLHSYSEAITLACYVWLFSGAWDLHYSRGWTKWASIFLRQEVDWRQNPRVKRQLQDAGVDLGCIYSSALPSSHVGPPMVSAWLLKLLPSQMHSRQGERKKLKGKCQASLLPVMGKWQGFHAGDSHLHFIDQDLGTGPPWLPGSVGEVQLLSE